ncbi:MAG: c-type cytochrome [Candidatus Omnitrophica bacterium]|nr:c-type cytochrome [Candidatus Omnitrophota bacterium]
MDPVALAFDEWGRLYVVENIGYPSGPPEGDPPAGRIARLEDKDGDGYYESRVTFADGFTFPNGILPWEGGVIVTCAPEVLYLKDTDGDGRADIRQIWLTGFSKGGSTQLRVSHPTLGLDGWIYLTNGLSGGEVTSPKHPDRKPVETKRNDFRFNPETLEVEIIPGQAQFGQTFDDYGRRFVCSNRKPAEHVVLDFESLSRNPYFPVTQAVQNLYGTGDPVRLFPISDNITTAISHAQTFTAACGLQIYRGAALPPDFYGNQFVCDPTGNLVHRAFREPDGASFSAERPREKVEFLASTDNWFRPVNLANGPDGALYLCDMYRKTIEHPTYLPEAIRAITDFETGKDMGRIYRFKGKSTEIDAHIPPQFPADMKTADLVELLDNPNSWWREAAQRLLIERKAEAPLELLRKKATHGATPQGRVLALWLLEGFDSLSEKEILAGLSDSEPGVRENSVKLAGRHLQEGSDNLKRSVLAHSEDPDLRVRFQTALTLGEFDSPGKFDALSQIAEKGIDDSWTRTAVLCSVGDNAGELLAEALEWRDRTGEGYRDFLKSICIILANQESLESIRDRVSVLTETAAPEDAEWEEAALVGLIESLQKKSEARGQKDLLVFLAGENEKVANRISSLVESAMNLATHADAPIDDRLAAVDFLQYSTYIKVGETLEELVNPYAPQDLQIAAAKALAQMPEPEAGEFLSEKDRWRSLTPPVRAAIISNVLTRGHHISTFLTALEKGDIQSSSIEPSQRKRLLNSSNEEVQARAKKIFEGIKDVDRKKVFEDYKSVLDLETHPDHGFEMFKVHCAQCHFLDGAGTEVGPDLTGIRTQPRESLLLHILIPNHETVPSFVNYVVETVDGDVLTGLIAGETPTSITLRRAKGEEETILRSDIEDIYSTNLSLMPQELEKNMSRQDLADLIGYLKGDGVK